MKNIKTKKIITKKFDKNGNLLSSKMIESNVSTFYKYDDKGRMIEKSDDFGIISKVVYFENGYTVLNENDSLIKTLKFDSNNNLIYYIDNNGYEVIYEYDKNGNKLFERTKNIETEYVYDEFERLICTKENGFVIETIEYFDNMSKTYIINSEETILKFYNDEFKLNSIIKIANGSVINYIEYVNGIKRIEIDSDFTLYDNNENPILTQNFFDINNLYTLKYKYDNKGNLVSETKFTQEEITVELYENIYE